MATRPRIRNSIPGRSPKRVPGKAKLPRLVGGHRTNVPNMPTSGQFGRAHFQQVRDLSGRFAGGWGWAWQGLADVANNAEALAGVLRENVEEAVERLASDMEEYMKENAKWTDHPGVHQDARDNLQAVVVREGDDTFTILVGHGKNVYYGIWLEVRWGGRYAIVLPTVYRFAPEIGNRIRTLTV